MTTASCVFRGKDWAPQADGVYRLADGTDRLVFRTGTDGRRYVATNRTAYQLMSSAETVPVNLFAIPALIALAVPVAGLVRRFVRKPASTSTAWRLARGLAAASACRTASAYCSPSPSSSSRWPRARPPARS